mmetsp:Transcript_45430/g.140381  ORF Transcript_45430/g.140381 Transcript_45430/m.140381 type:complete len:376 (+) Transcript_45430:117-1244(+)
MAATEEEWFSSAVSPHEVTQYCATAPRGMTVAPQSPAVRKQLLEDLLGYGVQLEHPSWPPPRPALPQAGDQPNGASMVRSLSTPAGSFRDIKPYRGPHLRVERRGAFGDVVGRAARASRRAVAAGPRRHWSVGDSGAPAEHSRRQDAAQQSSGMPTAFWRPTKASLEEATPSSPESGRRQEAAGAVAKLTAPGQPAPARIPTESELRNAREALRGQASLHTAAVSDRFRFAADVSAGAPIVIRGAGVSAGTVSASWASDASALINFHHGQIRRVAKSGLEPVKEPPKQRKKKKKDDIEDLQLSDSGLFQPKYPIDSSLKSLRRLKKSMFPEVVQREQEEAAAAAAAEALAAEQQRASHASFLKSVASRKPEPAPA